MVLNEVNFTYWGQFSIYLEFNEFKSFLNDDGIEYS